MNVAGARDFAFAANGSACRIAQNFVIVCAAGCGGRGVDDIRCIGGEDDAESASAFFGGLDGNSAAVFFDDAFGDGEAEAGALVAFGGVEWFKDPSLAIGGDARSVVDDEDFGIGRLLAEERIGDLVLGSDGDRATVGIDGFDGIGDQIDQGLVHEVRVERDGGHFGIEVEDEGHLLGDGCTLEELSAFFDERVELAEFDFDLALAAEGEHVQREVDDAVEIAFEDAPAAVGDGEV